MNSLYSMVFEIISSIMSFNDITNTACELVSIILTLIITYYIVFAPLRFVINLIFKKVKL